MGNQKGFTLIELVVVIVILGILAAVAVPKFIDMQVDARKSAINGLYGAVQSASALAHAQSLVKGNPDTIDMEGTTVTLSDGYAVVTDGSGINVAVNTDGFDYSVTDTVGTFVLSNYSGEGACEVTYELSTTGGSPNIAVDDVCE